MNYFNYFTEVENEFVKRRGSHMLVSPLDWALIEGWKQRGVPLHIVLRGINTSFDGYNKHAHRGRKVNSLLFCQQEIEAQYLEYCESRVGASDFSAANGSHGNEARNGNGKGAAPDDHTPFARVRLLEYLNEHAAALEALRVKHAEDWPLAETFARTAARLRQLRDDLQGAARVDTEALEGDLTVVETLILDALKQSIGAEPLAVIEADAKRQLRGYREKMGKEVYEQTRANYLARRLREHYHVPRLSLFYL